MKSACRLACVIVVICGALATRLHAQCEGSCWSIAGVWLDDFDWTWDLSQTDGVVSGTVTLVEDPEYPEYTCTALEWPVEGTVDPDTGDYSIRATNPNYDGDGEDPCANWFQYDGVMASDTVITGVWTNEGPVSGPVTLTKKCFDERDTIIRQYPRRGTNWTPSCADFTTSVPSLSQYSFSEWRSQDRSWTWAILKEPAVGNSYCVVSNYGSTPNLNSGYRTPDHNQSQGGVPNGRHVYGDAADLAISSQAQWTAMKNIAKGGACSTACVEPYDAVMRIHIDYRGACPTGW
jgi:hypothetical protein